MQNAIVLRKMHLYLKHSLIKLNNFDMNAVAELEGGTMGPSMDSPFFLQTFSK
jgi:hypothetical protein